MSCPFLKEGRALYCHAYPLGKLILEGPGFSGGGICASPEYFRCDLVRSDETLHEVCPHLEDVHVQYCGVSSPQKLIPFSESQSSSCANGGFRFCDSYLALAHPHGALPPTEDLLYSQNHFWLAVEDSGLCHVGIDSFLPDVVGKVDGITFATTQGTQRPVAVLNVRGVEWPMTFPNPLEIQKVNGHLRGEPMRLVDDPYGSGWLFSGWELPGETKFGLRSGPTAATWQAREKDRLTREVRDSLQLACDGGRPVKGIGQMLSRSQLVCLLQSFFSNANWVPKEKS